MLVTIVMLVVGGPPSNSCTIDGQIRLLKDGHELDPSEQVVVYVKSATPRLPGPVEPKKHTVRQINTTFVPRLSVVMVGDTIEFVNEDKTIHSVFSATDEQPFEMKASAKGKTGERSFMLTGQVLVQCDIHGTMRSDVLVLNNDRYAMPDKQGRFRLQDLPAGSYTLEAWEPNGATTRIKVGQCDKAVEVKGKLQKADEPDLRHKDGKGYDSNGYLPLTNPG